MTDPTVVTLPDAEACALAAAERIIEILDVAIDDRGEAHWVTTGGSSPAGIYRNLASPALRNELDWRKVRLWFTDERFVPLENPLSNAKVAFDLLLDSGAFGGLSGPASPESTSRSVASRVSRSASTTCTRSRSPRPSARGATARGAQPATRQRSGRTAPRRTMPGSLRST